MIKCTGSHQATLQHRVSNTKTWNKQKPIWRDQQPDIHQHGSIKPEGMLAEQAALPIRFGSQAICKCINMKIVCDHPCAQHNNAKHVCKAYIWGLETLHPDQWIPGWSSFPEYSHRLCSSCKVSSSKAASCLLLLNNCTPRLWPV